MPHSQAQYFKNVLLSAKNVDIICHESTDKDSSNSALALAQYLKSKDINSRIILSQDINSLNIKDKSLTIVQAKDLKPDNKEKIVFCVDFSSKERVADNVSDYIKNYKIYGIDHHCDTDITNDFICIEKPLNTNSIDARKAFYVDISAKSASAIIYRMFEALGENISKLQAYELLSGLLSDCNKKGLVQCDGKRETITLSQNFIEDKNSFEIFKKLISKLNKQDIKEIIKSIDLTCNLTPLEKEFQKYLHKHLQFSKNGKIAYSVIPPNSRLWSDLNEDNSTTSTIMNRFRQEILNSSHDIKAVLVFYKSNQNYRLSAHCKQDNLLEFFKYVQNHTDKNIPQSMGGHPNRGGGKLKSLNEKDCKQWISDIISCEDFFD